MGLLRYAAEGRIGVIGLGYVGLPLAVSFGKRRSVVGFDIDADRVRELRTGNDRTAEFSEDQLVEANNLSFSTDPLDLRDCQIFIVTVPTPVDKSNQPDLTSLMNATRLVAEHMPHGALIIFESTVYPGATEEICVPIIEKVSGKRFNDGFYCGYSPERINPGDKERRLADVIKITSGSTPEVAEVVDKFYAQIVSAGTHKVSSIAVAEAAKVIENTQRDLNIALMNELSLIFHRLGLDTTEVLEAASTKWNFLPFRPGLVGGHCIGVDPYYLTHKAQEVGYHPEVILAGRRINDGMAGCVADRVIKLMLQKNISVAGSRILVLGFTFKENCPDIRNTKVTELVANLQTYSAEVDVYDPWVSVADAASQKNINFLERFPAGGGYAAIVLAVAHQQFTEMGVSVVRSLGIRNAVFFDVKSVFSIKDSDGRL